jgi:epoxyqueuosine reductase
MELISNKIRAAMKLHGYKTKTVSIKHLSEVQEAVGQLIKQGLIAKQLSEKWHFYLESNKDFPEATTIIIIAIPQPITCLSFSWQSSVYSAEVSPNYFYALDKLRAEEVLHNVLGKSGYKITKARLALKTLAVRSGLAKYGKNNLAYVPRMGSFCRLIAFYTDAPFEEDNWLEAAATETCGKCTLCLENCPTKSITADRFLIRAEKCLGFLNETEPNIPYWVKYQPDWLNAFIGCMRCQFICPINKPYLKNIVAGPSFSEEETATILSRTPWEQLGIETRKKLEDLRGIYPLMAQNLGALIEKQKKMIHG